MEKDNNSSQWTNKVNHNGLCFLSNELIRNEENDSEGEFPPPPPEELFSPSTSKKSTNVSIISDTEPEEENFYNFGDQKWLSHYKNKNIQSRIESYNKSENDILLIKKKEEKKYLNFLDIDQSNSQISNDNTENKGYHRKNILINKETQPDNNESLSKKQFESYMKLISNSVFNSSNKKLAEKFEIENKMVNDFENKFIDNILDVNIINNPTTNTYPTPITSFSSFYSSLVNTSTITSNTTTAHSTADITTTTNSASTLITTTTTTTTNTITITTKTTTTTNTATTLITTTTTTTTITTTTTTTTLITTKTTSTSATTNTTTKTTLINNYVNFNKKSDKYNNINSKIVDNYNNNNNSNNNNNRNNVFNSTIYDEKYNNSINNNIDIQTNLNETDNKNIINNNTNFSKYYKSEKLNEELKNKIILKPIRSYSFSFEKINFIEVPSNHMKIPKSEFNHINNEKPLNINANSNVLHSQLMKKQDEVTLLKNDKIDTKYLKNDKNSYKSKDIKIIEHDFSPYKINSTNSKVVSSSESLIISKSSSNFSPSFSEPTLIANHNYLFDKNDINKMVKIENLEINKKEDIKLNCIKKPIRSLSFNSWKPAKIFSKKESTLRIFTDEIKDSKGFSKRNESSRLQKNKHEFKLWPKTMKEFYKENSKNQNMQIVEAKDSKNISEKSSNYLEFSSDEQTLETRISEEISCENSFPLPPSFISFHENKKPKRFSESKNEITKNSFFHVPKESSSINNKSKNFNKKIQNRAKTFSGEEWEQIKREVQQQKNQKTIEELTKKNMQQEVSNKPVSVLIEIYGSQKVKENGNKLFNTKKSIEKKNYEIPLENKLPGKSISSFNSSMGSKTWHAWKMAYGKKQTDK